ncbi:hypothetical protein H0H93_014165 [Arthromyces matolae]|nr:hypothetical protein H0H93_014165 [Arthromyces matolae]
MVAQKRALEDSSTAHKSKKSKVVNTQPSNTSNLVPEEVDFPRGGGTSFTAVEVKAIRAEAAKEANEELFVDAGPSVKKARKKKRASEAKPSAQTSDKPEKVRIEHLNYKRMNPGMKILGQIVAIQPLALIVSLPNQLFAHVPLTHISNQLTAMLERAEESAEDFSDEEGGGEVNTKSPIPELSEIFHLGQYVRGVVTTIYPPGSTEASVVAKTGDEVARTSRRVELSLFPERVNAGVHKTDLKPGFALTGALKSIEDHGYILDLGLQEITGFLSFKHAERRLQPGQLLDVTVTEMSNNGRICNVIADQATFSSTSLSEVANASSILPGALVNALITSVTSTGLNLQILGFFEGTVDRSHLQDGTPAAYKVGKKIKARVLYDFSSSPPRFALAITEHILALKLKREGGSTLQEAYPIGKVLDQAKITQVESERGVVVKLETGLEGFVHISHISDDHVPTLSSSSGPWKIGTIHRARVIGYFPFDGLLQLSFKPSILEQRFLQVDDIGVGEIVIGTIKKLTDNGLFVSLSGNIDGIVWPNHYADIVLKHPSKRFKNGANIKCRVLVVDKERKRISLTAKKSLLDSKLPIVSTFDDAKVGVVTHAVIFKVNEKHLTVEFFNNLRAIVPLKEASETTISSLADSFPVGRVVRVRVIATDPEHNRIIASIRQTSPTFQPIADINAVEIGHIVQATVSEIHKDNVVLTLQPTQVRGLISLKNLANHRKLTVHQLCASLKTGDLLEDLVVVTRNAEKGFVIVASKPQAKVPFKGPLSLETVIIGQLVGGRVTRQSTNGTLVKFNSHIGGILHPTDTCDDFEAGVPFPAIDSLVKAVIIDIDRSRKQLTLSTRHSKMYPDQVKTIVDRHVDDINDLHPGETIRGFIKSVTEHGLFVTLGRGLDARVQIRELFDEYVKEWKDRFNVNQLVKGRILSVDTSTKKIEMTFRSGTSKDPSRLSIGDLQIGQKVEGTVKRIENYGLFIQIQNSKLTGLCHKSQLSDNQDADVEVALQGFREGDHVKAMIQKIDKNKISLSLKPSNFDNEDFQDNVSDHDVDETFGAVDDSMEDLQMTSNEIGQDDVDDEDSTDENDDRMDVDTKPVAPVFRTSISAKQDSSAPPPQSSLQLMSGFSWSNDQTQVDHELDGGSSSDDSENEASSSKKKQRKRREIEYDITADMHTRTPESSADFERRLLGSPNSSYLWIQYMSFQLQLSEIDKAREIAKRAITTISFREEQERLNVWIALLNLENVYGTDELLESTFKDAAKANDSKTIHLRLASILAEAGKHERAEDQFKRTCKKFGQSSKVWTSFGEYYLHKGDLDEARKLLPRSLQSLEKRKHLKTISKFAYLEYKLGEPERGKTLFEGIVDSHPKRWDLWSIYMDMEAGQGDMQSLRNLFGRVFTLKMTSHKAKDLTSVDRAFFKKWLELERRLGDEEGAQIVKQKAIEWTQRANTS